MEYVVYDFVVEYVFTVQLRRKVIILIVLSFFPFDFSHLSTSWLPSPYKNGEMNKK